MSYPEPIACVGCSTGGASTSVEGAWLCPGCAGLVERSSLADLMRYGPSFQRRRLNALDEARAAAIASARLPPGR